MQNSKYYHKSVENMNFITDTVIRDISIILNY